MTPQTAAIKKDERTDQTETLVRIHADDVPDRIACEQKSFAAGNCEPYEATWRMKEALMEWPENGRATAVMSIMNFWKTQFEQERVSAADASRQMIDIAGLLEKGSVARTEAAQRIVDFCNENFEKFYIHHYPYQKENPTGAAMHMRDPAALLDKGSQERTEIIKEVAKLYREQCDAKNLDAHIAAWLMTEMAVLLDKGSAEREDYLMDIIIFCEEKQAAKKLSGHDVTILRRNVLQLFSKNTATCPEPAPALG